MQQEYILHNDQFIAIDQTILTAKNRGFRYGDGLFESMRMSGGKLKFAELHADRLQAGMNALKMEGGILFDDYFLKQKTAELCKRNKLKDNVRFRLSVYREGDGLYTPDSNKSGYVLEAGPLATGGYELNKKGLIINVYDEITKPINKLSTYKTSNSLLYVMAGLYKQQNRLDEAFILNQHGFLCESISSNVFVIYDKQIYTPALSEGCIAGVMRNVVMKVAKTNQIPVIEAQINPEVLNEADEVFITNATSGIRWVMGYGKKRYFNEITKSLSSLLNAL
ncbi:branched-chain amino acid aminotransferase [Pedobacter cryoconitis]|uniref:branched-chain-amino-acid transaminase n=1 Tax=Pedobacter cryoconitis TaxID=188932 RepID=A0A7W9DJK4_9SPHI|nr:aminotransferase class IV [Pedobacter cryoconitis]MBB5621291.1 branched-chain amino acid aminotransferase [Pedobacter cryoconitis]MBB5649039.1 branched-chain amino acid aminotransferase [Pedobacter cryoconitis]